MNLLNFSEHYPDESSCRQAFKAYRDKVGVVCPRCGGTQHYWKSDRDQYQCKSCGTRQTLRSHTVMHGSKLPFRYWFIAMHLLTSTKKSFSALELQRQLGHKFYEPVWNLLHKLRRAMGTRDEQYSLIETIELDDGFFSIDTKKQEKGQPLKRGRGSQKKSKVLVMAESEAVKDQTIKKGKPRKVRHVKMVVMPDLKSDTVTSIVEKTVSVSAKIHSDDSTSYTDLSGAVAEHHPQVVSKEQINTTLPWVHIAISNAKRMLLDVYHHIDPQYLQSYLNEFCYKFNRQYFGEKLFDRLLIACVSFKNNLGHYN